MELQNYPNNPDIFNPKRMNVYNCPNNLNNSIEQTVKLQNCPNNHDCFNQQLVKLHNCPNNLNNYIKQNDEIAELSQ